MDLVRCAVTPTAPGDWPFAATDRPSKIVCIGSNYVHHIQEMGGQGVPREPTVFLKPPSSLTAHDGTILIPGNVGEVHHEIELGVIIGKRLHRATAQEAPSAIRGWCLAIDVTARDLQRRAKESGKPWALAKGIDTFCPVSRELPATAVDPRTTRIELDINGEPRQAGRTGDMIWPVPDLMSYVSQFMTLEPGDLLLTGTPEGVGPLADGDRVEGRLDDEVLLALDVRVV